MRLRCYACGKSVSTEVADETVVRACLFCPECIERKAVVLFEDARRRECEAAEWGHGYRVEGKKWEALLAERYPVKETR